MKKIVGMSTFLFLLFIEVKAQNYYPGMWVDKIASIERKASYNLKHHLITRYTAIDQTDSIYYPDFFNMIKYFQKNIPRFADLRIYIAQYPTRQLDRKVPVGWDNKLTLIFAPMDATNNEIGGYFIIHPGQKFDAAKGVINPNQKRTWTRMYINNVMPALLETLDKDDDKNYTNETLSDTRSIKYLKANIDELLLELDSAHQSHHRIGLKHAEITGMKMFFASYTINGDKYGDHQFRLHLQFEFTNDRGEIIYLDDDDTPREPKSKSENTVEITNGVDNGQLCPANCP